MQIKVIVVDRLSSQKYFRIDVSYGMGGITTKMV